MRYVIPCLCQLFRTYPPPDTTILTSRYFPSYSTNSFPASSTLAELAALPHTNGGQGEEALSPNLVDWLESRDDPWTRLMVPSTQPRQHALNNQVDMLMAAFDPTGPN